MLADLEIGTTAGETVCLDATAQARNLLLLGPPGSGKSMAMFDIVRQWIITGQGFALIDPDGTLCDRVVELCAEQRIHRRRRIHVVNPHEENWSVGFNSFRVNEAAASAGNFRHDAMLVTRIDFWAAAVAQVFAGEDPFKLPLLRKCLRATGYALAYNDLTLAEAPMLTTATDWSGLRGALIANLPNETFRAVWEDFNALSRREYFEQFGSTMNRLVEFVSSPLVRRVLCQQRRALDLRTVMNEGHVLLVNLAPSNRFSPEAARLLGTMIVSDFVVSALSRDEATGLRRPFHLMIDEAPQFLTSDIELLLDRLRKRGLHLTLAMQRLGQARKAGDSIYSAIMVGCQSKLVFRQQSDEDAVLLATELFRSEFDLDEVKLWSPAVVGHHREMLTGSSRAFSDGGTAIDSETESGSEAESEESSEGYGESEAMGEQWSQGTASTDQGSWIDPPVFSGPPALGWSKGETLSSGGSRTNQQSHSRALSSSTSRVLASARTSGHGRQWSAVMQTSEHEALVPDIDWIPSQLVSLEEIIHKHAVLLRELPDCHAYLQCMDRPTMRVRTIDVNPAFASPRRIAAFIEEVMARSPYASRADELERELTDRRKRLARLAEPVLEPARPTKDSEWG